MFTKDLKSETSLLTLLKAQSATATANGTGVDISSYCGNILVILNAAAATAGINPTLDVKIQDSADNSSFADVSGYAFTQVTTTDSLQGLSVDTRLCRKYIRVVITIGGTSSPAFPVAVSAVAYPNVV
jgi:hypothetical protein